MVHKNPGRAAAFRANRHENNTGAIASTKVGYCFGFATLAALHQRRASMPHPPAKPKPLPSHKEEEPPFLGSWKWVYWFVLGLHCLVIVLFYLFTNAYA
ncbi:MAG: hypothetical protein HC821_00505 [Lewinella sp.]|nr:hypothetical protein [Lewinella sp.]